MEQSRRSDEKFCYSCGKVVHDSADSCPHCGANLKDEVNVLNKNNELKNMSKFKFDKNDIKAFQVLDITIGLKWEKIQNQFKKLVKKFHPDMNAGDKKYEEKLKIITLAYTQLKKTYRVKIDR